MVRMTLFVVAALCACYLSNPEPPPRLPRLRPKFDAELWRAMGEKRIGEYLALEGRRNEALELAE